MKRFLSSCARLPRVVISIGLGLTAFATLCHTAAYAGIVLTTPSGVAPGGTFRFIGVTATTTDAAGWSTYTNWDNFVNDVTNTYGGVTYEGQAVTGWLPVVGVGTTNPRDHIGGFGTNVPFYMQNGTRVASSATTSSGGLWSGSLQSGINRTLDGTQKINNAVWTNSNTNGTINQSGFSWDYGPGVMTGKSGQSSGQWLFNALNGVGSNNNYVYTVSPVLTAPVPEPSTCAMALASLACGGYSLFRRRNAR